MFRALEIMTKRWPETIVVISLHVGAMLILGLFGGKTNLSEQVIFLMGFAGALFAVLGQVAGVGFLRSAYLEPEVQKQPLELIAAGWGFFWRILLIGLLFGISLMVFTYVVYSLASFTGLVNSSPENIPQWVMQLFFLISTVILVKPILLLPAIIIVFDVSIKDSFRSLANYKIAEAKTLLLVFLLAVLFNFAQSFIPVPNLNSAPVDYVLYSSTAGVSVWLAIFVSLGAVLFVSQHTGVWGQGEFTGPVKDNAENSL